MQQIIQKETKRIAAEQDMIQHFSLIEVKNTENKQELLEISKKVLKINNKFLSAIRPLLAESLHLAHRTRVQAGTKTMSLSLRSIPLQVMVFLRTIF
jgi:hypothetical protein